MPSNDTLGFKRFDIFKKMPRDLTEPTVFGAIGKLKSTNFLTFLNLVSIICTVILIGLTIFEI